jgi:transposase
MSLLKKGVNIEEGKPYPPEFRAFAVRLHRINGRTSTETAREIGVSDWTLSRWVLKARIDEGKAAGLTTEEREELLSLRRENKTLKEEREILRKAVLFLARKTEERK